MTLTSIAGSPILRRLAQHAGGGLLGLGALIWIAQAGPFGEVVIYVTEEDVEIEVGGQKVRIKSRRHDPLIFDLAPGRHELVVSRGGRVLYRERFEVRPGRSILLTAYDPGRLGPDATGTAPAGENESRERRGSVPAGGPMP